MRWTDDRIAERIHALDPAKSNADEPPTAEEWARLQSIIGPPSAPAETPSRFRGRGLWALPAAASVVAIALGIASATTPPAFAETPPPLVAAPIMESSTTFVEGSIQILLDARQSAARREGQLVRWQNGQDATDDPVIVPARYDWDWSANGVGSLTVTAAQAYSVLADGEITKPAGPAPTPGTQLHSPDKALYFGAFPTVPPANPTGLADALRRGASLPASPDALEYWGAFQVLLNEWTLTPAHHAAMLQILEESGGFEMLGTVTDRLGRQGIALQLHSSAEESFDVTIVVDRVGRQIIAADVTYAGGLDVVKTPVGSVVEYSAWLGHH